ncbi:MAG: nucleoside 2-deoxyribosyltransferase [Prolixibacteraceae bacterium]|nr:nucleoside 2-deoxyribosyltransferase [Prolixibacteraceae bacterium]
MRIYFAGSIRGGREDAELYNQIINYLKNFGEVLTEHIGDKTLSALGDDGPTDQFIHDRDMEWLLSSDVVVAEVTTVSLGVGYEIGRAVENNIPVLCLYRPQEGKKLSAMISGNEKIKIIHYSSLDQVKSGIKEYLRLSHH